MKKLTLYILLLMMGMVVRAQNSTSIQPKDSLTTQIIKMESDKVTYNVQADPDARLLTVLEILRRVPMVIINGQDEVQINGATTFSVYVNGKPNVMMTNNPTQAFRSMPASNVSSIEVITNPGARYDAEGISAVLNINTTQASASEFEGHSFNGSVNGLLGNRNKEARAYVSGQKGRFTYTANVMTYDMHALHVGNLDTFDYQVDDQFFSLITGDDGEGDDYMQMYYQQAEFSLGYEPDDKSAINASFSFNNDGTRDQGDPFTFLYLGQNEEELMTGYIDHNTFRWSQKNYNLNLSYQRYLDDEQNKNFLFSYILTSTPMTRKEHSEFESEDEDGNYDLTDRITEVRQNQFDHNFQTDFSASLDEHHSITTGAKYVLSRLSSKSNYYVHQGEDYGLLNLMDYRYTNNILAGYAEYEGNFNKLGVRAGLRYEHTWQKVDYRAGEGENFKKNYGQLVPSASMVYNLSNNQSIGLNYNMSIIRPLIAQLDPYIDRSDPTSLEYGNSYLNVVKNHTINMVYNLFTTKLSLNLTLQHTFSNNDIGDYTFQQTGIMNTTFGNIVKTRHTGLSLFANWAMTNTTQITLNGNIAYNDLKSKKIEAHSHGWSGFASLGVIQALPWKMKLNVNLNPSSKTYTLQGWYSGHTLLSGSITKGFFDDRLGVTIAAVTALGHGGDYVSHSLDVAKSFTSTTYTFFPVQQISIGLTYNFGNKTRPRVQPYAGSSFVNRVEQAIWE